MFAETTTKQSTTESSTTSQLTTESSTTPSQSTTEASTTPSQSTTESSTTSTQSTTPSQSTEASTTPSQSTTEASTTPSQSTKSSTTPSQSTTEASTTPSQSTKSSTTPSQSTTEASTTSSQSTTVSPTTQPCDCKNPLPVGVSDGKIPDSQMKSNSIKVSTLGQSYTGPEQARLNNQPSASGSGAWEPKDKEAHLDIIFNKMEDVREIRTQGSPTGSKFARRYFVFYSLDGEKFMEEPVQSVGVVMIFLS